jgi:hypothetical protein
MTAVKPLAIECPECCERISVSLTVTNDGPDDGGDLSATIEADTTDLLAHAWKDDAVATVAASIGDVKGLHRATTSGIPGVWRCTGCDWQDGATQFDRHVRLEVARAAVAVMGRAISMTTDTAALQAQVDAIDSSPSWLWPGQALVPIAVVRALCAAAAEITRHDRPSEETTT